MMQISPKMQAIGLKKFIGAIGGFINWIYTSVAAILSYVVTIPLSILIRVLKLERFRSPLGEAVRRFADRLYANSDSPVLRGNLREVAEVLYPRKQYPQLYRAIPRDLYRHLIQDGRVIDGSFPAPTFAPAAITDDVVGDAAFRAFFSAVVWTIVGYWLIDSFAPNFASQELMQARHLLAISVPGADVQSIMAARPLAIFHYFGAVLIGAFAGFATIYMAVRKALDEAAAPFYASHKEAVVKYEYNSPQRKLQRRAYIKQLEQLDFDKSPTIAVGRATGAFRLSGDATAPTATDRNGDPIEVRMSIQDLRQNLLIVGGTGEGKSRAVLRPLAKQLLSIRAAGVPLSMYVTDGKGVLWKDVLEEIRAKGLMDDVRIIGVGEDHYGVDLLAGMDAQMVSDTIHGVMTQIAGGQDHGDKFWDGSAAHVIRNAAEIARVWEHTADAEEYIAETSERVYALTTIYRLCMDAELMHRASMASVQAMKDEYGLVGHLDRPAFWEAISFFATKWVDLAEGTKSGIEQHITNALSGFLSQDSLRERFAAASAANMIDVDEVFRNNRIVLTALNSIEHGVAGRVILTFLKARLYHAARARELADPEAAKKHTMVFMADEFQDIATADAAGLSDATFWAVSRSSGVAGIVATQSLKGLAQAIGQTACETLQLQFRSKIALRVEDEETVRVFERLAGETLRSFVLSPEHAESFEALKERLGYDPSIVPPAAIEPLSAKSLSKALVDAGFGMFKIGRDLTLTVDDCRNPYDLDARFLAVESGTEGNVAEISAAQAAVWRMEDKNEKHMMEGNHHRALIDMSGLMRLGRHHAYVYIQRAGAAVQDIVETLEEG